MPTGVENVKAQYRVGIGAAGNAASRAASASSWIVRLARRKCEPAAGAGRRRSGHAATRRGTSRRSASRRSIAWCRSSDYRDFAQLFAGIAKARRSRSVGWRAAEDRRDSRGSGRPADCGIGSAREPGCRAATVRRPVARSSKSSISSATCSCCEAGVRLLPDYLFAAVQPLLGSGIVRCLQLRAAAARRRPPARARARRHAPRRGRPLRRRRCVRDDFRRRTSRARSAHRRDRSRPWPAASCRPIDCRSPPRTSLQAGMARLHVTASCPARSSSRRSRDDVARSPLRLSFRPGIASCDARAGAGRPHLGPLQGLLRVVSEQVNAGRS